MCTRKFYRRKEHNGVVLIAAVFLACAVLGSAGLILAIANSIFDSFNWQTILLKRENIAVQAEALAEDWFINGVKKGLLVYSSDFESTAKPKDDPYVIIPPDLLEELKNVNNEVNVEVIIADQNYSTNFKNTADAMGIPLGRPSQVNVVQYDASPDVYYVKRFQILASISSKEGTKKDFYISKNILVLKDRFGTYQTISLYTKKQ